MSSSARDVFADKNAVDQMSTTVLLEGMVPNGLSHKFETRSPPMRKPVASAAAAASGAARKARRAAQNNEENVVNSPPQNRANVVMLDKDTYDSSSSVLSPAVDRKRCDNPTRSPATMRRLPNAVASASTSLSVMEIPGLKGRVVHAPEAAPKARAVVFADATLPASPVRPPVSVTTDSPTPVSIPTLALAAMDNAQLEALEQPLASSPAKRSPRLLAGKRLALGSESAPGSPRMDKQRKLFALAKHPNAEGLRDRGSSDMMIRATASKRGAALRELLETERRYCARTGMCRKVRDELQRAGAITEEEGKTLFINVNSINKLSETLLADLVQAIESDAFDPATTCVAHVWSALVPFLKLYGDYLNKYGAAQELLALVKERKKVVQVLEKTRINDGTNMCPQDLQNWIAEPMQRITRYPMMLEGLLKHTPNTHPDYAGLLEVHQQLKALVDQMNERVRRAENEMHYALLREIIVAGRTKLDDGVGRELLYHGTFRRQPEMGLGLEGRTFERSETSLELFCRQLDSITNDAPTSAEAVAAAKAKAEIFDEASKASRAVPTLFAAAAVPQRTPDMPGATRPPTAIGSVEDEGELHAFLCRDLLLLATATPDKGGLCVRDALPLAQCWVLHDDTRSDELIVAWPGGVRRLVPDASIARCTAPLPVRNFTNIAEWRDQLVVAIERRVAEHARSLEERRSCAVWIEHGSVVVERCTFVAPHEEIVLGSPLPKFAKKRKGVFK